LFLTTQWTLLLVSALDCDGGCTPLV
jgi:hypothetical protein